MRRGFTIAELVIAIALVALVASLALPASVALLNNEGRRSGLFACESALRAARERAMRDKTLLEIGAIQDNGVWSLAVRPYRVGTAGGRAYDEGAVGFDGAESEDEPAWDVIATLPKGFAFRFEPMPMLGAPIDSSPITEDLLRGVGPDEDAQRVAIVLPSGVVEGIESWRLVTDALSSEPRVDVLRIARWTGAVSATRELAETSDLLGGEASPSPAGTP